MDVLNNAFKGIDLGTYSTFRLLGQQVPELVTVMHGSAIAGSYLWIFFLAILVYRWRSLAGGSPSGIL